MSVAENVHCKWDEMFTLTTILEWGQFEISTTILLCETLFWKAIGAGVSHCRSFLKKRGNAAERLERELATATKRQQKLELKVWTLRESAVVSFETGATGGPCAVEASKKETFSAV